MHMITFMRRKEFAIILGLITVSACGINNAGSTKLKWRADMEVVAASLETIHPNAWFRYSREDWQGDYDKLSRDLPNLTEYEIITRI